MPDLRSNTYVEFLREEDTLRVVFLANLQSDTIELIKPQLETAPVDGISRFILDFRHVDYVDSLGLSTLVIFRKNHSEPIGLEHMSERVENLFRISRILLLFDPE